MSVDPRILAMMSDGKRTEDELPGMTQPQVTEGSALPVLRGTPRQIKWAETIREEALALNWPESECAKLTGIVDSTWWIANRLFVNTLMYKEPLPHQMLGGPSKPARDPAHDDSKTSSSAAAARHVTAAATGQARQTGATSAPSVDARMDELTGWAHSVSRQPRLAAAAILATLSKLYKEPEMKAALKREARELVELGEADLEKDVDAINRMLS